MYIVFDFFILSSVGSKKKLIDKCQKSLEETNRIVPSDLDEEDEDVWAFGLCLVRSENESKCP